MRVRELRSTATATDKLLHIHIKEQQPATQLYRSIQVYSDRRALKQPDVVDNTSLVASGGAALRDCDELQDEWYASAMLLLSRFSRSCLSISLSYVWHAVGADEAEALAIGDSDDQSDCNGGNCESAADAGHAGSFSVGLDDGAAHMSLHTFRSQDPRWRERHQVCALCPARPILLCVHIWFTIP